MSTDPNTKTKAFIAQLQQKMQGLLAEFANGKLNRDQFHAVYEHYNGQLAIAEQALSSGSMVTRGDAPPTVAILEAHMGKAIGVVIYNNRNHIVIDTLGEFDVPPNRIAPILNDFSLMVESGKVMDYRIEKMSFNRWLLFVAGQHTTIVTLFKNEPSPHQCREMERLHRDFEVANQHNFKGPTVDASKLAYPFLVFIQRKIKK